MKTIKPNLKPVVKSNKTKKNVDIKLNLEKLEKVCLTIYSFFSLFVLIGLIHFLYISLGFKNFEIYYVYILLGFLVFYFIGKKAIKFAFHFGCD